MPSRLLLPAILLLPLAEIAMFVLVGQRIGVAATVLAVLASTFAGIVLMRRQGLTMIRGLQAGTAADGGEVMRGMLHMVAGMLLVIPGFITSMLGLLLLLPVTRGFLWRSLKPEVFVARSARFYGRRSPPQEEQPAQPGPSVIDLDAEDFRREDRPGGRPKHGGSPWAGRDPDTRP